MNRWLGRLWFAPTGLQEYARKGRKMEGIYLPYWTFDAHVDADWTAESGYYYYETETYRHVPPATDAAPPHPLDLHDPVTWHRLTQAAVLMAWHRDPEVMCDLVATLMDIHLHHCQRRPERTLDELHLMIALELQQLSGEPD